ncbi:hypothetical protein MNB_SV-6-1162 [hydrothermal vent metagenome]|uniref:Uncharacterized protein n=1 Tax=hydrothermal vent metagenome TaxID=652676 RepID=A0A1W1C101_9ZZZZ
MKQETKIKVANSVKIVLGVIGFIVWIDIILTIASSPAPFIEQAPYCMVSTMIISAILTGLFKGVEYWSKG